MCVQIWQYKHQWLRAMQGPTALLDALFDPGRSTPVVAFVGAGGKSTLMDALATQAVRAGRHVLMTTTTHIWRPENGCVVETDDVSALATACRDHAWVTAGLPDAANKLAMLPSAAWKKMRKIVDLILIEADGARCHPIKAPRAHEPVLPPQTTHVCAVVGLTALGKPIEQVGFGVEPMCELLQKSPHDRIDWRDVVRLCASKRGGRKRVPWQTPYCVCLHQADTPFRLAQAARIARALQSRGVRCLITAAGKGEMPCAL